jgi:PQQ-like domain
VSIDVAGGLVIATTGNNFTVAGANSDAFHAFDLATGTKRWVKQVRAGDLSEQFTNNEQQDTDFGANPILAEVAGRRVVAAGDKGSAFWELDRETGQILWSRENLSGSHSWNAGGVMMNGAFDGRYFYVVSNEDIKVGGATLHKLDPQNSGVSVWTHRFDDTSWGALSLANGLLLVPNNTQLYVLDADSGATLNHFETGGTIAAGAAAIAQGKIVVKSGFLSILDAATRSNNQIICYGLPSAANSGNLAAGSGGTPGAGSAGAAGTAAMPASSAFSAIYKDILVGSGCTSGQCHSGPAAGGLDLRARDVAYMNLVSVPAGTGAVGTATSECAASGLLRVAPGDPDASLLMLKIEHRQPCGAAMPSPTTMLAAPELERIRTWIAHGAMND